MSEFDVMDESRDRQEQVELSNECSQKVHIILALNY